MKRQGIRCLSIDEVKMLLNYLSDKKSLEREYFLIDLVLQTGLRIAEVHALNVGDVMNKKKLEIVGKGDKSRSVPLNSEGRKHTEYYLNCKRKRGKSLELDTPLFISRNGNRLSVRAIQRAFDRVLKESGINNHYTFHSLRHTFATETLKADRNIRTVQELLGHSRLDTTMVYTYVNDEDKQRAVDALSTAYKGQNTALER